MTGNAEKRRHLLLVAYISLKPENVTPVVAGQNQRSTNVQGSCKCSREDVPRMLELDDLHEVRLKFFELFLN